MRGGAKVVLKAAAISSILFLISGCISNVVSDSESDTPAGAKSNGNFTPTLSSNFDEPWSTEVTRQELVETALYKLFRDLDTMRDDNCAIKTEIFVGDPMLDEHRYLLEAISDGMVSSFCGYLTTDIPVLAGRYEFVKETLAREGLPVDKYGGVCGFDLQQDYASACAINGIAWIGISLGSIREGESFIEERRLTIAAHELFHVVHDQINPEGDPGSGSCRSVTCKGPVWFIEGAGEFFGRAMTQYLGLQNYATFVPTDRNGMYMDAEYLSDLDFLTQAGKRAGSVENYYSGQIAIELLIANVGLLPVLEVWENLASEQPFPVAFEGAIGIPLGDFYEIFKVLHTRLYEEGGYCKSTLGCSPWNKPTQRTEWYQDIDEIAERKLAQETNKDLSEQCLELNEFWWSKCTDLEYEIPDTPENSNHGYPIEYERIPKVASCDELPSHGVPDGGWAKSFAAREAVQDSGLNVSTQIYAAIRYLDTNLDGVLCSAVVSE